MLLSCSLLAPFSTAWSGYHCFSVERVVVVVAGRLASPVVVVVVVVVAEVRTGSSTNFSLLISTLMSCSPMPRNPPTPITTPSTLPDLSSRISLMSPSFSLLSLYTLTPISLEARHWSPDACGAGPGAVTAGAGLAGAGGLDCASAGIIITEASNPPIKSLERMDQSPGW